ncbi:hypothetical protein EON67_11265 [archaeon]|nr:MAG: hypothetical protein EON67_11265 [archaeon]
MVHRVHTSTSPPSRRCVCRASGYTEGDVNDASGFSPFPGNINQLVFKLGPYVRVLERTGVRPPPAPARVQLCVQMGAARACAWCSQSLLHPHVRVRVRVRVCRAWCRSS